jgi:hypothetical protein
VRLARDEGGEDPLLTSLAHARDRMLAAERDLRLLIAYAREFAEPRPYRLDDLARAAGMSISGDLTPPAGPAIQISHIAPWATESANHG